MKKWIALCFTIATLYACTSTNKKEQEINAIDLKADVALFHDALFNKTNYLSSLKTEFPYMFTPNMHDSIITNRQQDTLQHFLYKEVKKVYPDFAKQQTELTSLFKHITYYYKGFVPPKVVTDITGVSYQDRVLIANNLLLISLDMYLGKQHEVYTSYPGYLRETFSPNYLMQDVCKKIIASKYRGTKDRTFLGKMIFEGKKLYLESLFLPKTTPKKLFGYTTKKLEWAQNNEAAVWSYFIKNELLYSYNAKLKQRFIDIAPFSKFYMSIDKQSPGGIAKYIGYKIVKAYADKHTITPQELMTLEAQTILNQSGFKPKKK